MILAQNMPPGDACVVAGLLILGTTFAGCIYAAYRYGYRKGKQCVLDEKRRGFAVLPSIATKENPPEPKHFTHL